MKRRTFLRTAGAIVGAGLSTGLYAWQIEPYWLEFIRHDLPIANLPDALVGNTLLQLSDLHVGNRFDYQFLIDSMERARALDPDIVVYTGDYVSWEDEQQLTQLKEVMQKAVLGKLGTYAILGNHDYGHHWREASVADSITTVLEESKVTVLRNASARVAGLTVLGIDEWLGTNFNPAAALSHYRPEGANLVLCHNPDVCDLPVWENYRGWILAGHTHGGQCKLPLLAPPIKSTRNPVYTEGKFDLGNGRLLYINRALGCSYPVRFNVRPEITVFTLSKAVAPAKTT